MSRKQQLKALEAACREINLRLTPQRLEVFAELARAADHPTAEALHQRLVRRMPSLSLDTVYRTLATFAEHNLINRVETAESQARYEVPHARHHHLICRCCKAIMDFDWPQLDRMTLPDEVAGWGHIEKTNLVVYGRCRSCQEDR